MFYSLVRTHQMLHYFHGGQGKPCTCFWSCTSTSRSPTSPVPLSPLFNRQVSRRHIRRRYVLLLRWNDVRCGGNPWALQQDPHPYVFATGTNSRVPSVEFPTVLIRTQTDCSLFCHSPLCHLLILLCVLCVFGNVMFPFGYFPFFPSFSICVIYVVYIFRRTGR